MSKDVIEQMIAKLGRKEAQELFNKLSIQYPIAYTGLRDNQPPYPIDNPPTVKITKTGSFDSAHNNRMLEGKCQYLHGHTYKYRVTVFGVVDPNTGIAVDFRTLKQHCKQVIDEQLDHKYLNEILPFHPSAENLAIWIFKELDIAFNVASIELWENEDSYVIVDKSSFTNKATETRYQDEPVARQITADVGTKPYREGYDG